MQYINVELVQSLELQLEKYEHLLKRSSRRRKAYVISSPLLYFTGSALEHSVSKSTWQIGWASVASADALNHLDAIIPI